MPNSTPADSATNQSFVEPEAPPYPLHEPLPGSLALGPKTRIGSHSDVHKGTWTHNGEQKAVCIKCLRNTAQPKDSSCPDLTPEERFKRVCFITENLIRKITNEVERY